MPGDDTRFHGPDRDVVDFGPMRPRSPRWWLVVAAGLVVVVAIAVARQWEPSTAGDTPTPARSSPGGGAPDSPRGSESAKLVPVDRPLLGVRAGWELFGRADGEVVRIELAAGRVSRTAVPPLQSTGPVSFVVGRERAIIRPLDRVPGYVVPDEGPARRLSGTLGRGGTVFPGPKPGQVWAQAWDDGGQAAVLVRENGRRTGVSIPIPDGSWVFPDGAGYLLIDDTGGFSHARPRERQRITRGSVLAVGPTHWLIRECSGPRSCALVVMNRGSGARRVLTRLSSGDASPAEILPAAGMISPDGSTAAVLRSDQTAKPTLHLLDLETGADHPLSVSLGSLFGNGTVAWSPDSRWLFVAAKRLVAIDARTHRVHHLDLALPPIRQVAVRPALR